MVNKMNRIRKINNRKLKKEKIEKFKKAILESVSFIDQKLVGFVDILDEYGFFLSLDMNDIDWFINNKDMLSMPLLTSNDICMGFIVTNNEVMIGVDPKYCFNKISQCSILAHFPMSKREYKRFVKLFHRINDNFKAKKYWIEIAQICWYGDCIEFGK